MFCPGPTEDSQIVKRTTSAKKHRKPKKKYSKQSIKNFKQKQSKLACTMSTWAENFTVAATWQLKHQIAYWKARAKALEYENGVLHDIIRKNQLVPQSNTATECDLRSDTECAESEYQEQEQDESEYQEQEQDESEYQENEGEDFEVSEEFIQFLTANAKYKEDAKRERERLKAKEEEENQATMEAEPRETVEDNRKRMKELYGDQWQRISALEMSLTTNFIHESDKSKPSYWPNIPFNFNS